MRNLYLFPAAPFKNGGYNIAVLSDYNRLHITENDVTVWNQETIPDWVPKKNAHLFKPASIKSRKALTNMLKGYFTQEFSMSELSFLKDYEFENIFCDEVIFYRTIRKMYPHKKLTVRFHNLFYRILVRNEILKIKTNKRFQGKLKILTELEKEIFNDKKVHKIFITEEDALFYQTLMASNDYEIWSFQPDKKMMKENRKPIKISHKLVWLGGVESHKTLSVKWFIENVFPYIKKTYPDTEFHLYGSCTESFDNPHQNIFGHGFYKGEDIPMKDEALYINPDILGGGVKIKLLTYFNNGIPFISTPFGYEGYDKSYIDNLYCNVVEEKYWCEYIISFFDKNAY